MFSLQVNQFRYIHRNIRPKVLRITSFNTRIVDEFVFTSNQKVDVEFFGRGGTSLRDVVTHMQNHPAECHIIFTDGYFNPVKLEGIKGDVLFIIYDNPSFTYEGATDILFI